MENWRGYENKILMEQKRLLAEKKLKQIFLIEEEDLFFKEFEKLLLEEPELLAESFWSNAVDMYNAAKAWPGKKITGAVQKILGVAENMLEKFDSSLVATCDTHAKLVKDVAAARGLDTAGLDDQCKQETKETLENFSIGLRGSLRALQTAGGRSGKSSKYILLIVGAMITILVTIMSSEAVDPTKIEMATQIFRDAADIYNVGDPSEIGRLAGEFVDKAGDVSDKLAYAGSAIATARGARGVKSISKLGHGSIPVH